MNTLEDKLRAALEETAREIGSHGVPALRLRHGRRRLRLRAPVSRHRWLTPMGAAASVAAVVAATLALAGSFGGQQPGRGAARPQAGPFSGLPPCYVALTGPRPDSIAVQRQAAVVRATVTGQVLATVTAPKPYSTFVSAAGAGNGRVFVLAAARLKTSRLPGGGIGVRASPVRLFLLRIGADGRPALTALPVPAQPAGDMALSPDGSKLALSDDKTIHVFDLATGAERTWTWPGRGRITNNAGGNGEVLSWTADGRTLAFQQWVGASIDVRLLDTTTTTAGGSLQRASRLALQWKDDAETWHLVNGQISNVIFGYSAIITPDGSKIVAATGSETRHPLSSELMFTEFSTATGRPAAVLGRWHLPGLHAGQIQDVLWSSPAGDKLIVVAHKPGAPAADPRSPGHRTAGYAIEFGVQTASGFTPLPGAPLPGPHPWPVW